MFQKQIKARILKSFLFTFLILAVILMIKIFYPRSYQVAQIHKRDNIQYWNLTTGSRIAYTLIPAKGQAKPFPIIFLQGGPGGFISARTVAMLAPLSENGYTIYLYDQIGSGHSARLGNIEDYTALRHKKDLEEIVGKTGAEQVILIGQSWGALLATLFMADNPEKVRKAVFTGPGPVIPVRMELADVKAPDSLHLKEPLFTNAQANAEVRNMRSRIMLQWALLFGSKLATDKEADDFQTLLNNKLNKSTVCDTAKAAKAEGGGGYYAQIMTVQSFSDIQDPREKLKKSDIPVLIMKGQCDNQKWGFTSEYLQIFRHSRLVIIPDAGHSISIEQPDLYLKTILEFLNE